MLKIIPLVFIVLLTSSCSTSVSTKNVSSALLSPWEAGMTPETVKGFKRYAPYKSFSNGDIETFSYPFEGKNENAQFFFKSGKLNKIGLYLYEGNNIQEARKVWLNLYLSLKRKYGKIELPSTQIKSDKPVTPELLSLAASSYVQAGGNTQMSPIKQPKNTFIYSSFKKILINNKETFLVILFYNKSRN